MISPNLVLTVAHNIYNRQTGEIYKDFKFYPQQFGKLEDPYEIEDFFFPWKFCLDPDVSNDYALLKLKKRKQMEKFIPLSGNLAELRNRKKVSIYGYPADRY